MRAFGIIPQFADNDRSCLDYCNQWIKEPHGWSVGYRLLKPEVRFFALGEKDDGRIERHIAIARNGQYDPYELRSIHGKANVHSQVKLAEGLFGDQLRSVYYACDVVRRCTAKIPQGSRLQIWFADIMCYPDKNVDESIWCSDKKWKRRIIKIR